MLQIVSCDLCGSANYKKLFDQKDIVHKTSTEFFSLVECIDCGLNYINPRPDEDKISNYYPDNYNFFNEKNLIVKLINFILSIFIKISPILFLLDFIPIKKIKEIFILRMGPKIDYPYRFNRDTFFLDIGSGSGETIHFWNNRYSVNNLSKKFKNIYAIEPSKDALKKIILENKKKSAVLTKFDNIKFDHIRMNWSLEHVHSPSKYFEFISQNLKKDGKFLLCIPNYDGLIYKLDNKNVEIPLHLFHFKFQDIKKYCEKFNLKILEFQTFSYPGMYYFSSKINNKFKSFEKITIRQSKRLMGALSHFDKMGIGNDMIFIISK